VRSRTGKISSEWLATNLLNVFTGVKLWPWLISFMTRFHQGKIKEEIELDQSALPDHEGIEMVG